MKTGPTPLQFFRIGSLFSLLIVTGLLGSSTAQSGEVPEIRYFSDSGRIDLKAEETPLQNITNAVGTVTGIKFILPHNLNPSVTLEVENIPLERALNQVFKQALGSEKNAAMVYVAETGPDGLTRNVLSEVRIVKGGNAPVDQGVSGSPASVYPSVPPARQPFVRPPLSPGQRAAKMAEKRRLREEKDKRVEERKKKSGKWRGGKGEGPKGSATGVKQSDKDETQKPEQGGSAGSEKPR